MCTRHEKLDSHHFGCQMLEPTMECSWSQQQGSPFVPDLPDLANCENVEQIPPHIFNIYS
jgi:hypothetical protein